MIGYYVHHHGAGHLARARCVAAALDEPVVVLSSLELPDDTHPFAGRVALPRDDAPGDRGADATVGGALHWAPYGSVGYGERMALIAAWVRDARPSLVVVDVSVEVTALVRLLGVPVVVMAGSGVREDDAHRFVHRAATAILAPWAGGVLTPPHLAPWADKVTYTGAMSRFDGRVPPVPGRAASRRVLLLVGRGDAAGEAGVDLDAARRATPGWTWRTAGVERWSGPEEVWDLLTGSDVVVCHAGMNALAEVAAARRPAVVLARPRPFDEQAVTAAALDAAGVAVAVAGTPAPSEWPDLLARATARGGAGWARWSPGDGAARAADVLRRLAADVPGRTPVGAAHA